MKMSTVWLHLESDSEILLYGTLIGTPRACLSNSITLNDIE